jgi:hypothetical protein
VAVIILGIGGVAAILFIVSFFVCLLLEATMKYKSERERKIRAELLSLFQVRKHWERLEEELRFLDESGRRAWLYRMRSDSEIAKQSE